MRDLPCGWACIALEELIVPRSDRVSPQEMPDAKFIGMEHVEPHTNRIIETVPASTMASNSARFFADDVLYGRMRPYLNKVVSPAFDGLASAEFIVFPRSDAIDAQFLLRRLSSSDFTQFACSQYEGDRPRVKFDQLGKFDVLLPPRAEQTRIVEKLEELLGGLDVAVAELKAAQRKLTHYRQSLLKAAMEGALTEARRNANAPQETGIDLLRRILQERRTRWEEKQQAKFAKTSKAPPKGWQAKYPEPVAPDTADLPALPEGWAWASLDALVADSSYGTSAKCGYGNNGTPVLRIPNVSGGDLDLRDMKFSDGPLPLTAEDFLDIGDVLVIRTNGSIGLVGRAAAVTAPLPAPHYFASYLLRLRCVNRTVLHHWVSTFLASPVGRRWIEERVASSAGQHNVSLSTLLTMPVPLPAQAEQTEILAILDTQLSVAKEQETAITHSLHQAAAQRRNLLRSAFSGHLVPQDPNDEPASALLARIRAAKVENTGQKKSARKRTARNIR